MGLPAPSPCLTEREGTEIVENEPVVNTAAQALDEDGSAGDGRGDDPPGVILGIRAICGTPRVN
ncbi:MAG TPA: hypothetical protein VLC46_04830 [Thermoanaerobaculia bacterium]|jgi:hypothetical protein|nr:hypothetical protein [Thermoanaerobaculia bacterium]